MNVPLLDLKAQYRAIKAEVMAVVEAVCDEQGFVLGPRVAEFEAAIARYVGCRHGIGCASGSDALLLALMALGFKQIEAHDAVKAAVEKLGASAGVEDLVRAGLKKG